MSTTATFRLGSTVTVMVRVNEGISDEATSEQPVTAVPFEAVAMAVDDYGTRSHRSDTLDEMLE